MLARLLAPCEDADVRRQLGLLTIGRLVSATLVRFAPPFLPTIARGLGVPLDMGLVLGLAEVGGLNGVLLGRRIDRSSRRVAMLAGTTLLVVAAGLAAASPSLLVLGLGLALISGSAGRPSCSAPVSWRRARAAPASPTGSASAARSWSGRRSWSRPASPSASSATTPRPGWRSWWLRTRSVRTLACAVLLGATIAAVPARTSAEAPSTSTSAASTSAASSSAASLVGGVSTPAGATAAAAPRAVAADRGAPTVTGPVTAGSRGYPFFSFAQQPSPVDLAAYGYVEEEFFLEGTATSYVPATEGLAPDGRWAVQPDRQAPYRTRLLVIRPADRADFNGTAFVEWNNVTASFELFPDFALGHEELLRSGYAYVSVSAQYLGLNPPYGVKTFHRRR